jgi:nucleoside-diphosphate-sugar epimerase
MGASKEIVLVTGSSGLVGSALIRALLDRYAVVAFDREGPPHPPPGADWVFADLTSDESVQNAMTHVRLDYGRRLAAVVHLAAYYDFSGAPSGLYDALTVGGTERMLRELRDFEVGQFLFSSTLLVHAPGRNLREDSPLLPKWPYPASKLRTEELLRANRGALPLHIQRIAGIYTDRCNSIPLARQMQRIYERRLTGSVFPGDPSHGQTFVHLDDAVDALLLAIDRRAALAPDTTVLIGEPVTVGYADLQKEFGRLLHGREWPAWPIPKPVAKFGAWVQDRFGDPFIKPWMIDIADDHYEIDPARARALLGWVPKRSLLKTLPSMAAALLADPPAWYLEHDLKLPARLARKAA